MRVALMAVTGNGNAPVRLGGRPVAWHQLQTALGLGCERVVCLAEEPGPSLAALQREAEARHAKFNAISHPRALSGLVNAADTLFVFAPGVLPDREWLSQALGARAGIAALPADRGVEQGFERIDRGRAWGGVLATRGDAVEALAALPVDADPIAGLLRVALQRGGRCVEIPERWLDEGRWAMLADEAAVRRVEAGWHSRHVPPPSLDRPGEAVAHRLARKLLPRAAEYPKLAPALSVGGIVAAVAGGVAGYLGSTIGGMVMLVFAALLGEVGDRLIRFDRAGTGVSPSKRMADVRTATLDAALVAVAASPQAFSGWAAPFAALMVVGAVRLAREGDVPRPVRLVGDRILVVTLIALASSAGVFDTAMAALAVLTIGLRVFWPRNRG